MFIKIREIRSKR